MKSKINFILIFLALLNITIYIIVDGHKNPLMALFPIGIKKISSNAFYYTYFNINTYNTTSLIFYLILPFLIFKNKILKNKAESINNQIAILLNLENTTKQLDVNELSTFDKALHAVGLIHTKIAMAMILGLLVALITGIIFFKSKNVELTIIFGFATTVISIINILYIIYCFLKIGNILKRINSVKKN
jgi:hypothetical protein